MTNPEHFSVPPRTIHPLPRTVNWESGSFIIDRKIRLHSGEGIAHETRVWMADTWRRVTLGRIPLEVVEESAHESSRSSWRLGESPILPPLGHGDHYGLQVGKGGVGASARNAGAAMDAWKTLLQLLWLREVEVTSATVEIPHGSIHDAPAMPFRGLHLCIFPETTSLFVEKVITAAAFLKYSHLVLEFWGTLKLETLPELGWPNAWSKAQASQWIHLARTWGMEVVPMYNIWGHAASCRIRWGKHVVLDQNPALSPLFEPDGWTWCLSHPRTLDIHKNIASELAMLAGDGNYFHIGCDESYSHATCDRCRIRDRVGLWADHVNAMSEHLHSIGRRPVMWGDPLLEKARWPGLEANGTPFLPTHQAIDRLDKRLLIADWHYESSNGDVPTLKYFKSNGFEVLASPWHELSNIRTLSKAAISHGAMGLLATTWHRLPQHMPMLVAAANGAWSSDEKALGNPHANWDLMGTHLATNLRRFLPSGGDFAKSGWHPFEVSMQE